MGHSDIYHIDKKVRKKKGNRGQKKLDFENLRKINKL